MWASTHPGHLISLSRSLKADKKDANSKLMRHMNSLAPRLFRWLVLLDLSACSVSAPLSGTLQVPVHSPDSVPNYVTHYAVYSGGKITEVGYEVDLRGKIASSILNTSLLFNLDGSPPHGEQDFSCTGLDKKGTKAGTLDIPLSCSMGHSGVAQVTITNVEYYSGYGTFHLSDGSSGYFSFGIPAPCGCALPPPPPPPVSSHTP